MGMMMSNQICGTLYFKKQPFPDKFNPEQETSPRK